MCGRQRCISNLYLMIACYDAGLSYCLAIFKLLLVTPTPYIYSFSKGLLGEQRIFRDE